ncbi:MAG: sterol carrier protein domain-containing protein, partial [Polyangiaceae bacterium]
KQRDQIDDVEITVPFADPLVFAFHDAPGSRRGTAAIEHPLGALGAGPMVRLSDPARALSLRGYLADGEVLFQVSETPNAGTKPLHLVVKAGVGEVSTSPPSRALPTVQLTQSTLGSIVAAGMRPSDAAALGLTRGDTAALAAADALFAGPRFQCLDPF